jgi:enoyl-CoA hydratase/carnithine racemase
VPPARRNNYSAQFGKDLIRAFELFDRDDRVRAVVVTAKPTAFAYCAGVSLTTDLQRARSQVQGQADITKGWSVLWDDFSEKEGEHGLFLRQCHCIPLCCIEQYSVAHRDAGGQLSLTIFRSRKITIAAVNGHAGGVGMTAMQLPFDLRFAWSGAKLTFPFVRRGISAEGRCLACAAAWG